MHEAGVAQSIIDISSNVAKQNKAKKITLVSVRIGKMSAIDINSLTFAFDAIKKETMAEDAVFECVSVDIKGKCESCGHEDVYPESYFLNCRKCGSVKVRLTAGDEMEIAHIEVE